MAARHATIRKSDLKTAFEAAKAAGYQQVSIAVETADGKRFLITAGTGSDSINQDMTPLERWRVSRAAS